MCGKLFLTPKVNIGLQSNEFVNASNAVKLPENDQVGKRMVTSLDRLVQILEISFIFLLIFSLIALIDTTLTELDFYQPLSENHLGRPRVGSLSGGNWEQIVRITLIFNLLLFGFSLFFGIWMRRSRDGWTWADLGYTFSTGKLSFIELVRRGFVLGLVAIILHFTAVMGILLVSTDRSLSYALVYFNGDAGRIFTPRELNAEYYFGIVEMGFIWPLSAGFFFFAYAHKSLNAKFPTGVANLLSTAFYVFYLQFFFLIEGQNKLSTYANLMMNPFAGANIRFWIMSLGLFLILYINFSAFAETGSIVLPFLLNFVYNVGITLIQAGNALIFEEVNILMFIPFFLILFIIIGWYLVKPQDLDTIRMGIGRLREIKDVKVLNLIGYVLLFILLSFIIPALTNELLYQEATTGLELEAWVIPVLYSFNFILLILMAMTVLTYEPTEVWDVLLVNSDGTPIASHIEIFETDDVLISGFFTALQAVDQELSKDGGLKAIKRGEREILIENGVFSQIIALADKDQVSIRNSISKLHREFEVTHSEKFDGGLHSSFEEATELVDRIGDLSITFNVPDQTKWITIISLALAPIMIALIGLL